jgi:hypothetical protein
MREILLTKGMVALVDDEDFEALNRYKWHASGRKKVYADHKIGPMKGSTSIKMHRAILNLTDPNLVVDHIDGNTLNNQKYNLRICKFVQNTWNTGKHIDNTTGFKGVHIKSGRKVKRYACVLFANGKHVFGGNFDNPVDAAKKYNELSRQYHGEFAYQNPV